MNNSTLVTEFLLEVFAESCELRILLSVLFLLVYLGSLFGNLIIIIVTTVDQTLNTPMYFFLRNLSIVDMCYVSVTVPNACFNSLTGQRNISVTGCAAQIFFVFFCACVEMFFLTIMAQDRYVAICKPLLYPVIMNHQFCVQMTLASLHSSLIIASVHTFKTFQLSFCHSNVVPQFFCDIPSLLKLSCSDTFNNKLLMLISAIIIGCSCFTFIAVSYFRILSTVLKVPVKGERGKAFSTCVPHIVVVSVFLSSSTYVYLRPPVPTLEVVKEMALSVSYTIVPPFLNPIIYSLRNRQIKEAVKKVILRISLVFEYKRNEYLLEFSRVRKLKK
ncbi:olfactory receptor family 14 subfamily C member 43 [Mus musculus]|jgi:olfactory receptor|uniref:Olfactory receptor Olfr299 n=1 Tax=Mus musculus TaxID=10090 RepID=Q7TS05_MOUSE|nr:olfactory receptor family 14 subfamily C member 43 [Mus musculus]AAP70843.1 olfactory receptor Olfr299 [Mus musculus]EDL06821.1 olfactory receptor 299 [Mus musculus]|eukprot:NP_001011767.1 olfactory receptor 299 [Mus musculus]